ncbi:MAG: HAD-IA family hydrolase [Desulfobacteraceae bacterium]|nr:HAD-IA family hydrolase [Desulfobacteraceae bacterium]
MRDIFRKCLTEGEQAGRHYVLMLPHDTRSGRHGYYPGNATGNSLEFRDFRDYQAGDDLRHIDWGAYGRSDKLIVKLFRDEVDPHVDIVIDCSRSMAVEDAVKAKAALGLAALLRSAASNAKCTCYSWMAANGCREVENGSEQPSVWNGLNFESKYSLLESFTILPPKLRKRGIRILLSDLLFPGDPLHVLRHMGEDACEEGVNLAIATNENRGNLELLANALNINQYFGATLCEDEVFCPKPHPEMAYRIMEEMDSSPFSTLVVGDSVLDMKMARTAGCYTCAVAYGTCSAEKLRKQSPDRIIHRFEELAEIPDKWSN